MRLIKRHIERDRSGSVTLCPEDPEDMWHAYNLILPNDLLTASAVRRVTSESSTGATSSQRVQTNLTIRVGRLDFDSAAGQLHVSGKISRENRYTKVGQHHTLDLELNRNFTLEKEVGAGGEGWDSVSQDQLREATDPNRGTEAVAVVMNEGEAKICLVTQSQTLVRATVSESIPRKRREEAKRVAKRGKIRNTPHDRELQRFFKKMLETLMRQMEVLLENAERESKSFPILLASPGFVAPAFLVYISGVAASGTDKVLQGLVKGKKFVVVHTSTGSMGGLREVLSSPEVTNVLQNTRYAQETALMDEFFVLLRTDDGRAWYGPTECERVVAEGAVGRGGGVLLINNGLFRSQDVGTRRRWVRLVDRVRDQFGGDVRVLSEDHESGKRLQGLGGIAAILTYPILELEDEEQDMENGDGTT